MEIVEDQGDEKWKWAALGAGGFLAFSLLPIWRSGNNRGQNLWEFLKHHSIFSESEAMWITEEQLEAIRREARA